VALWALPSALPLGRREYVGKATADGNGAGEPYAAATVIISGVSALATAKPLIGNDPIGNDPGPIPQFLLRALPGAKS
jgi:hypothetical protein